MLSSTKIGNMTICICPRSLKNILHLSLLPKLAKLKFIRSLEIGFTYDWIRHKLDWHFFTLPSNYQCISVKTIILSRHNIELQKMAIWLFKLVRYQRRDSLHFYYTKKPANFEFILDYANCYSFIRLLLNICITILEQLLPKLCYTWGKEMVKDYDKFDNWVFNWKQKIESFSIFRER